MINPPPETVKTKTIFKKTSKWSVGIVLGILCCLTLADLYLETIGVPVVWREKIIADLEERGIIADAKRIKLGLVQGIKVYDFILWDEKRGAEIMMTADKVKLNFGALGLSDSVEFNVKNAEMHIPVESGADPENHQRLTMTDIDAVGKWQRRKKRLELQKLTSLLDGFALSISGEMHNLPTVADKKQTTVDTEKREPFHAPQTTRALKEIQLLLKNNRFSPENDKLKLEFKLDFKNLKAGECRGFVQLDNVIVNGVFISDLNTNFSLHNKMLSLNKARLNLGADAVLAGESTMNMKTGDAEAKINGGIQPKTIYRLLEKPMPRILAETTFTMPPHIHAELQWNMFKPDADWSADCKFKAYNLRIGNTHLQKASGEITGADNKIILENIRCEFDGKDKDNNQLTMNAAVDNDTQEFTLDLKGTPKAKSLLEMLPPARLPIELRKLKEDLRVKNTQLTLKLECRGAMDDFKSWRGRMQLGSDKFRFRNLKVDKLNLNLELENEELRTTAPASCELDGGNGESLSASGIWHIADNTFEGRLEGALDFIGFYRDLKLPESNYLNQIEFQGAPARFEFTWNRTKLNAPLEWVGHGTIALQQVMYENVLLNNAKADIRMRDAKIFLTQVELDSPNFEQLKFEKWEISLDKTAILVVGKAVCNPADLGIFADRGDSRREYKEIWKDFDWGESQPTIILNQLKYERYPDEITKWRLHVDADLQDENADYRGFQAQKLSGRIQFNLPGTASITDIKIERYDGNLDGNVFFDFKTDPVWWFDCKGTLDPTHLFRAAGDNAKDAFKQMTFDNDTQIKMQGRIYMRGGSNPQLQCRFAGANMTFENIKFNQYELTWNLDGNDLRWNLHNTELHGGTATANGLFNWFSKRGSINAELENVDISKLIADLNTERPNSKLGMITAEIHAEYGKTDENAPLRIRGSGQAHVSDGNLWEAPLIKQLGSVIGLGSLGRISEFDTKLIFAGDRLKLPNFATNGTLLSLEGDGEYQWHDHSLDFDVKGRALKTTGIFSKVFTPLSWLFEAHLGGTLKKPEWTSMSKLKDLLPGN